jgi:hypothetical protein
VVSTMPRPLYPWERPGTHCTGDWVGPRAGLDVCEKSGPTRIELPDLPACSQSLYRLSYLAPGLQQYNVHKTNLSKSLQWFSGLDMQTDKWTNTKVQPTLHVILAWILHPIMQVNIPHVLINNLPVTLS